VGRPIAERKRAERATQFLVQAGRLLSSTLDVEDALTRLVHQAVREVAEAAFVVARGPRGPRCLAASHRDARQAGAVHEHASAAGPEHGGERPRLEPATVPGLGTLQLLRVPLRSAGFEGELVLAGHDLGQTELLLGEEVGRRVHDALEHAQLLRDAQEANRLKDDFLATLSHELRTPLNAIVGWSHVLQGGHLDEATIGRASDIIARNAQSQVQLISDLLDVSRIAAGKLRLAPAVVDLQRVLQAAVDAVKPALEARGLTLELQIGDGAWPLWADAERLQQVAWNLLSNAVKFTPRGGRVEVAVAREGDVVVLRVQDDGPGIDLAFLPYVFDRFRQADASTTRSHGGLGLGMAIVPHLVEAHGGEVSCANRDDGRSGARFTVRLPQRLPPTAVIPSEGHAAAAVSLEGIRVVVVDDEPDSREIVCTVLGRQGAEVTGAGDAAEGFDLVRRLRPHVLVSDIQMAGEDGYALLRRIRALPADEGGLVAAAALSAYAGLEHRAASLAAGFHIHVAKPVLPAELVTVVAGLAGRHIG
jgi:signal transduction histidine kinase/ActR/RegA family two-component response regulator